MAFNIKTGVASQTTSKSSSNQSSQKGGGSKISSLRAGKVFGVTTTVNTPNAEVFDKNGGFGGMGTAWVLDYEASKTTIFDNTTADFEKCTKAKPLFPNSNYFPLVGEIVYLLDLPSVSSEISPKPEPTTYYVCPINAWNNPQLNIPTVNNNKPKVGKTFIKNPNIRRLLNFEGDYIIQGRKGNSIRFGATVRPLGSSKNEWSSIGLEGQPIIIIANGHDYDVKQDHYIEQINKEASSIYLTSNQSIPLKTNVKEPINFLTLPTSIQDYIESQAIINADRVILNSKADDVMLFAYNNIELSTNNIINFNAGKYIHLNVMENDPTKTLTTSPKILLGTKFDMTVPTEPVLLGKQTSDFLLGLLSALDQFALSLTATATNSEGSPLSKIQGSAEVLQTTLKPYYDRIQKLLSKTTFTV
jgi:hypothetical protein